MFCGGHLLQLLQVLVLVLVLVCSGPGLVWSWSGQVLVWTGLVLSWSGLVWSCSVWTSLDLFKISVRCHHYHHHHYHTKSGVLPTASGNLPWAKKKMFQKKMWGVQSFFLGIHFLGGVKNFFFCELFFFWGGFARVCGRLFF